jgi:hypothetical protein
MSADEPGASAKVRRWILGAPVSVTLTQRLPLQRAAVTCPQLRDLLARGAHRRGSWRREDNQLRWENVSDVERVRVILRQTGSSGEAVLEAGFGGMVAIIYFAAIFAALFLTAALGGFALGVRTLTGGAYLVPVGLVLGWMVGRLIWRHVGSTRHGEMDQIMWLLAHGDYSPAAQGE